MGGDDIMIYGILLGSVFVFGGAAALMLSWAVRNGQFENLERGSRSIFDPAEPIGEATDSFPDVQPEALRQLPRACENGTTAKHE